MLATAAKPLNAYDVALENFDLAANALGLDDNIRAMIKYPERILCVSVPVRMDTRQDCPLRRLSRAAQHHAWPGQGRHPISPQRYGG